MFFSIAIPTYGYNGNGGEYLENNLNVLMNQTFKNFEVVISDHSVDDSIKTIVDKFKYKLNINYFVNERGRGVISPNLNECLKKCVGEYIKILFQDDYLFDEKSLENTYIYILQDNNLMWFATKFFHTTDGKNLYNEFIPKYNSEIWTGKNTIGCPSVITVKNKNIILFDEDLNWLMDVDYYKKMYDLYGEPGIINIPTVINRNAGDNLSSIIKEELKIKEYSKLLRRYA